MRALIFLGALLWSSTSFAEVVAHPRGCPSRAFCGCGASVYLFGKPIRELFLARNWFRFPQALPAPRMAGVRRHHVFVLVSHVEGDVWQVYDANSGGRRTRIHNRSIAGYRIVNPNGGVNATAKLVPSIGSY